MPPCKRSLGFKEFECQIKLHSSSLQGHSERMQKDDRCIVSLFLREVNQGSQVGGVFTDLDL